jgi:Domain of unknown function (DUF4157)
MSTAAPSEYNASKSPSLGKSAQAGLLLQRKCACGGSSASLSGEREECKRKRLQKRLSIGASNDPLEQEADRVADHVLAGAADHAAGDGPPRIQRFAGPTHVEDDVAPPRVERVLAGGGRPLEPSLERDMGQRFGHDFSRVRVHTGAEAAQSARDVNAHAYTVGHDIVFDSGRFSPGSHEGRRLLAHELTHVVQQTHPERTGAGRDRKGHGASPAAAAPRIGTASRTLSRQAGGTAGTSDAGSQAEEAERRCDIGALCRLSFRVPTIVTSPRMLRAYQNCHPGVPLTRLVAGNLCLTPDFGLPPSAPAARPRRAPGTTPAAGGGAPAPVGGLALPSTTIRFNLGPAAVSVDLPASLSARLPVPFHGAQVVVFTLNASPSEFSFGVTINAIPHVRIMASASATTAGHGAAGLTIQTTRTVCHAVDPATARLALQSAGTRLHDAIQAVQTPPTPAPDASELERTFAPEARLAEVVTAVAHLKSEIDRFGALCREVPVATFQFGVQGPLTAPETPPGPGTPPPATYVGGTLRFNF